VKGGLLEKTCLRQGGPSLTVEDLHLIEESAARNECGIWRNSGSKEEILFSDR